TLAGNSSTISARITAMNITIGQCPASAPETVSGRYLLARKGNPPTQKPLQATAQLRGRRGLSHKLKQIKRRYGATSRDTGHVWTRGCMNKRTVANKNQKVLRDLSELKPIENRIQMLAIGIYQIQFRGEVQEDVRP